MDEQKNREKDTGKISGLKNGIIKGDVVLSKDKKPYIIEVACRLSGGWFSSHQIPDAKISFIPIIFNKCLIKTNKRN